MRIARELELRLERLVDGLSAALFRGRMHPVDLANRLIRYIDLNLERGPAGPEIPNRYRVGVNPKELDPNVDSVRLSAELANSVAATAVEQGWRIGGPVSVDVVPDPGVAQGSIRCRAEREPGELPSWGQLIEVSGDRVYELRDNRNLLGRATDADVRIPHERVSRHHAVLFRESGSLWLEDLGSANGTRVGERRIEGDPVEVRPGDDVSLGPATFSLRLH